MTLRFPVCAAVLAAILVPAAASAAPPRSAQAFADAAARLSFAAAAQQEAITATDFSACDRAFERGRVPRRARERFGFVVAIALVQPTLDRLLPSMQQFVADLEAVRTADPALRGGRAAWRAGVAQFASLPRLDQPCEQLDRWAASGYAAAQAPPVQLRAMRAFVRTGERSDGDRRINRAVKRLRRLGVPRQAARRFTGEDLFDALLEGEATSGAVRVGEA